MPEGNLDLSSQGVHALIDLTNRQFEHWRAMVEEEVSQNERANIKAGDLMDLWFILSNLALQPGFQAEKKKSYGWIRGLTEETSRKYVATAQRLGLVETVTTIGGRYLRLSPAGQRAVKKTLVRWIVGFGEIQKTHFGG